MTSAATMLSVKDAPLLEAVLGLTDPWRIERVDLARDESCLTVCVGDAAGVSWPCPACGVRLPCHDRGPERVWRHLDLCQFRMLLRARVPRVACPHHGVSDVAVPWARGGSSHTLAMEQHIVELTESGGVNTASRVLQIGWEVAWSLMMSRRVGV
jgi:transposase